MQQVLVRGGHKSGCRISGDHSQERVCAQSIAAYIVLHQSEKDRAAAKGIRTAACVACACGQDCAEQRGLEVKAHAIVMFLCCLLPAC